MRPLWIDLTRGRKTPKSRSLPFETAIIERYKRREKSVEETLIEMYFARSEREARRGLLWGTRGSPSVVSDLNQNIYRQIEEWRNRPIEGRYAYVYLDWRDFAFSGRVE